MTLSLGDKVSSQEQSPVDLVRQAQIAEDTGFEFALISAHFHPWTDRQGQSPFVWRVIRAIAHATRRLIFGTAVTCPTVRIHPAIVAQAAATAKDEKTARRFAHEQWPTSAMESSLSWELPLPSHFETVGKLVTVDEIAESITCGPDPKEHLAAIRKYAEAGYDHICVHQVGKDQKGFFEFYVQEILPQLKTILPRERATGRSRRRGAR
jgi:Luciferase-like monooxygenase